MQALSVGCLILMKQGIRVYTVKPTLTTVFLTFLENNTDDNINLELYLKVPTGNTSRENLI